jgi:hypothetical protein
MSYLLIDPVLITLPRGGVGSPSISNFIASCMTWLRPLHERGVWVSRHTISSIDDEGLLPTYDKISSLLARHPEPMFGPLDVTRIFNGLFRQMQYIEDAAGIQDVVAENTVIVPGEVTSRLPQSVGEAFGRCLVSLPVAWPDYATTVTLASVEVANEIHCEATRVLIDFSLAAPVDILDVVADYQVFCDEQSMLCSDDVIGQWPDHDASLRIALAHIGISISDIENLGTKVQFGSNFVPSVRNLGLERMPSSIHRLMYVIACIVTDKAALMKGIEPHEIRESKGGGAKPVRDGNRRALRADVAHGYRKIRIHYWKDADKVYFSNVVEDNDDSIHNWGA